VGTDHDDAALAVAEGGDAARDAASWSARYRFDHQEIWRECSVIDITLDDAEIELHDTAHDVVHPGPFFLHIDSVAEDDVGITVGAVIRRHDERDDGRQIVGIEFSARREERMLLHLLVRLHAYA
jgi:hypothetical protein